MPAKKGKGDRQEGKKQNPVNRIVAEERPLMAGKRFKEKPMRAKSKKGKKSFCGS